MGHPAAPLARRATYADLAAVPAHQVAEIIRGTLRVMPRPAPRHASTSSALGVFVGGPFGHGLGGPGGWWILDEPEIHFPDPEVRGDVEVLVPDLAGWTRERLPELPDEAHFTLAPDWICEVLSPSTEDTDRHEKMPIYAREGVRFAWLIDPIDKTLEAYALRAGRRWSKPTVHRDAERVRVPPFDALELDLSVLWAK